MKNIRKDNLKEIFQPVIILECAQCGGLKNRVCNPDRMSNDLIICGCGTAYIILEGSECYKSGILSMSWDKDNQKFIHIGVHDSKDEHWDLFEELNIN